MSGGVESREGGEAEGSKGRGGTGDRREVHLERPIDAGA